MAKEKIDTQKEINQQIEQMLLILKEHRKGFDAKQKGLFLSYVNDRYSQRNLYLGDLARKLFTHLAYLADIGHYGVPKEMDNICDCVEKRRKLVNKRYGFKIKEFEISSLCFMEKTLCDRDWEILLDEDDVRGKIDEDIFNFTEKEIKKLAWYIEE